MNQTLTSFKKLQMLASDRVIDSNDLHAVSASKFNIGGGGGLDLNIKLPNTKSARKQ